MHNTRFLLEFTDRKTNDVIDTNMVYSNYLVAAYKGEIFDQIDSASKLISHQKLDVNTYICSGDICGTDWKPNKEV